MRKVILFIAMSLDGYIADNNGNVDWLLGHGNDSENIDIYSEFIQGVDTILMGWNTYHQITTDLSPTEWIYADLTTYVITHHKMNTDSYSSFCFTPVFLILTAAVIFIASPHAHLKSATYKTKTAIVTQSGQISFLQ